MYFGFCLWLCCLLPYIFGTMEMLFCVYAVFSTVVSYHFLWEMQRHTKTSIYNFQANTNIFIWYFLIFIKQIYKTFSLLSTIHFVFLVLSVCTYEWHISFKNAWDQCECITGIHHDWYTSEPKSLLQLHMQLLSFDCTCYLACIFFSKEPSRW